MTLRQQWVCSVCGYIYEDNIPFENLLEDWTCPICGEGKSVFYLQ
ncbi:MAG: rubredoxin [Alphaproteobacteria bacterium]|nr:rubredoxin [Alphaproteobacteria bacterium]